MTSLHVTSIRSCYFWSVMLCTAFLMTAMDDFLIRQCTVNLDTISFWVLTIWVLTLLIAVMGISMR